APGTAFNLVEGTDIASFPTLRSSADGLIVLAFDDEEPLPIVVGPGQARPGVLTAVSDDPASAATVTSLMAQGTFQSLVMLVANRNREDRLLAEYSLAGAGPAATSFRAACYGN